MDLHLKCNLCSTAFEVEPRHLRDDIYLHACDQCGALSSVKRKHRSKDEPPLYDFHGCTPLQETSYEATIVEPSHPVSDELTNPEGTAETDSGKTQVAEPFESEKTQFDPVQAEASESPQANVDPGPLAAQWEFPTDTMLSWIQEEAESKEEAALEGTVSAWKIIRENGQVLQFHFLTALRKWIMDGRITAGDQLMTVAGVQYKIEEYPGTADLFSNIQEMRQRRRQVLEKKKRVQKLSKIGWRHFKRRHLELYAAAAVFLILLTGVARIGWGKYQFHVSARKGEAYLSGLSRLNMDKAIIKDPQNLSLMLWTDDQSTIQLAMNSLTNQLSQNRQDQGSICLLTEGFVRKAVLSGNVQELTLARNLLDYLTTLKSEDCRWRAEAVYYWSQGSATKAQSFIAKYLDKTPDPYAYFIRGLLAVDQQDLQIAQRDMHEANRLMPNNIVFLSAIAKLLEKSEKWNEAIALLDDALHKDPNNIGLLKRLGYCYQKSGNLNDAEKIYQRGLQFTNAPEEFQYLLVSLYNNQSQHEQVMRAAHHYLDSYPEGAHLILVQQLSDQSQQALQERQAEEAKREARKTTPGNTRRRLWIRR